MANRDVIGGGAPPKNAHQTVVRAIGAKEVNRNPPASISKPKKAVTNGRVTQSSPAKPNNSSRIPEAPLRQHGRNLPNQPQAYVPTSPTTNVPFRRTVEGERVYYTPTYASSEAYQSYYNNSLYRADSGQIPGQLYQPTYTPINESGSVSLEPVPGLIPIPFWLDDLLDRILRGNPLGGQSISSKYQTDLELELGTGKTRITGFESLGNGGVNAVKPKPTPTPKDTPKETGSSNFQIKHGDSRGVIWVSESGSKRETKWTLKPGKNWSTASYPEDYTKTSQSRKRTNIPMADNPSPRSPTTNKARRIPGTDNPGFDTARFSPEGVEADYIFVKYDRQIANGKPEYQSPIKRKSGTSKATPTPKAGKTAGNKIDPNQSASGGGGGGGAPASPAQEIGESLVTPPDTSDETMTAAAAGDITTDAFRTGGGVYGITDTTEVTDQSTDTGGKISKTMIGVLIAAAVLGVLFFWKDIKKGGSGGSVKEAFSKFVSKSGEVVQTTGSKV